MAVYRDPADLLANFDRSPLGGPVPSRLAELDPLRVLGWQAVIGGAALLLSRVLGTAPAPDGDPPSPSPAPDPSLTLPR